MKRILNVKYGVAASIACLTFLVYLPALQNDFVGWDDSVYVSENRFVKNPAAETAGRPLFEGLFFGVIPASEARRE